MKIAGNTIRYTSKTLKKTRAFYPILLVYSTPAKSNLADFEMSKTSKIFKNSRDPYLNLF